MIEDGERIPAPSPARGRPVVRLHVLDAAKLDLHDVMLETGINDRELTDPIGKDERAVRRLRDPLRKSRIEGVEAALQRVWESVSERQRSAGSSG